MKEKKAFCRKSAQRTVNRMRLHSQVLARGFDDFTDEEFTAKLDINSSDREECTRWLVDNSSVTEENSEEIVDLYIVGKFLDKVFVEKLIAQDLINSCFADADDPWPKYCRLGTLDIPRGEQRGFHTFNSFLWEVTVKIAQSKNVLVTPTDYQIGSPDLSTTKVAGNLGGLL